MAKSKEYCPCCSAELVKDIKQLGNIKIWLVCPKGCIRKRPENEFNKIASDRVFSSTKKRVNEVMNKFHEI